MKAVENDTTVISFPENDVVDVAKSSYEPVRYNAMKHGILSKLAVLPHEDAKEFSDLLMTLFQEHQPKGITEWHLIEELAAIIWRKRRVLQAEGATINQGLLSVTYDHGKSVPAAAPFELGLRGL